MIHEVDDALRRLVREDALRGLDVDVDFDAPTRDWAAVRRGGPVVNVFLYDLRVVDGSVRLSYLLTAWSARTEDEHRLLSALLLAFLRRETVPPVLLRGQLGASGHPVGLTVALPPDGRSFAEVWAALGGDLKPSLDVLVSAPVDAPIDARVDAPVEAGVDAPVDSRAREYSPPPEPAVTRRWSARERRG